MSIPEQLAVLIPSQARTLLRSGAAPVTTSYWRDDLVAFLIGCSFSLEAALATAGVPIRHVEQGRNVPMYVADHADTEAW